MKILLFLLAFLPLACSSEDPEPEVIQPTTSDFVIYIKDACPDHNTLKAYYVSQQTHKDIMTKIQSINEFCIPIEILSITGIRYSGFYGGQDSAD